MIIAQSPNPPVIIALIALLISKLTTGIAQKISIIIFTVFIVIWAYEEIVHGVNWFRRTLGIIVLLAVAYGLFFQLR